FDASQDPATWKPSGALKLSDSPAQMIFSPSGEYVARQGHAGTTTVEIWSFTTGQLIQSVDATGLADLVGFIDNELFVASSASRLVIASVKTGKALLGRELVPPAGFTFRGRECSISPD